MVKTCCATTNDTEQPVSTILRHADFGHTHEAAEEIIETFINHDNPDRHCEERSDAAIHAVWGMDRHGLRPRDDDVDVLNSGNINKRIFGTKAFDTPKPTRLIEGLLEFTTSPDSLILDSFAGSGTTAHAVLKANAKDGGTRCRPGSSKTWIAALRSQ